MAQPTRWLWGLVPLALLWAVGNLTLDDWIERDVGRRAVLAASKAAGDAAAARPLLARVVGRDVTIGGEVLSADGAAKAMAQLRSEAGVRRVLGGLTQVVAQKPYAWVASREGAVVTLGGSVPDEATAVANVAAASAAVPGARIEDRQSLAFGAPDGFAAVSKSVLAQLADLDSGRLTLDDTRFCIEGRAATPEAFLNLTQSSRQLAPGFQGMDCGLEPPTVAPYRWTVEREADRVVATGFYPSSDIRQEFAALLRRAFPGPVAIDDKTLPALGAPSAFLAKVTRAVGDLARLRSGRASIDGEVYTIAGSGPDDFETCQALRLQIAQLDGPDSVAQASIACPPAPPPVAAMPALPDIPEPIFLPSELAPSTGAVIAPPPVSAPAVPLHWQAIRDPAGLVISGLVPSEEARALMLRMAGELVQAGPVDDRTTPEVHLASRPDFSAATRLALELVGIMSRGTATLDGADLTLTGEVSGENWVRLQAALARQPAPEGLSLRIDQAALRIRPYPLSISVDRSGVRLSGYLPDEAARATLLAAIEASPFGGKASDATVLLPGAPAGFADAARLALANLLRLDLGSASISADDVSIRGLTCRDLIKSEVETSLSEAREAGIKLDASIGLRQTGCIIDPPNTCQNDLDALTKRNTVLFGQGTSVVVLDATTERVVNEAFDILKQCPASRITVEGHANRDGEAKGFDNRDLSTRRAQRVRDELVKRGVDPAQLAVTGFGTQRPLVPHGAPEAKATNRRVQFTVAK